MWTTIGEACLILNTVRIQTVKAWPIDYVGLCAKKKGELGSDRREQTWHDGRLEGDSQHLSQTGSALSI